MGIDYKGSVLETICQSLYQGFLYVHQWTNFSTLLCLILLTPTIYKLVDSIKDKFQLKYLLTMLVLSFGMICAMLCVPYYAMGSFGAGRLTNVIYITYIILIVINYGYLIGCLAKYMQKEEIVNRLKVIRIPIVIIGAIFAILYFVTIGNGEEYGTSLESIIELKSGQAYQFDKELDERVEKYLDESIQNVEVNSLTVKPKLLYFEDLATESEDWKNVEMAIYYKKQTVKRID